MRFGLGPWWNGILLLRVHFWIRLLLLIKYIFKCFEKDHDQTLQDNATRLIQSLRDPFSKYKKYIIYFHEQHLQTERMKWAIRRAIDRINGAHTLISIISIICSNLMFNVIFFKAKIIHKWTRSTSILQIWLALIVGVRTRIIY